MVQFFFMHTVHDDSRSSTSNVSNKRYTSTAVGLLLLVVVVVLDLLLLLVGLVLDFGATSSGTVQQ